MIRFFQLAFLLVLFSFDKIEAKPIPKIPVIISNIKPKPKLPEATQEDTIIKRSNPIQEVPNKKTSKCKKAKKC